MGKEGGADLLGRPLGMVYGRNHPPIHGIKASGITDMQLFRTGNRLFMMMETQDDFSFEAKADLDAANEKVQEWETLMSKFQQPLPWAKPGEKWMLMERIFKL